MSLRVEWQPRARRALTKLPPDVAERIVRATDELAGTGRGQAALSERMARLEGAFESGFAQMDKRMGSLESLQRWGFGLYAVLVLAVLGLYFKGSL